MQNHEPYSSNNFLLEDSNDDMIVMQFFSHYTYGLEQKGVLGNTGALKSLKSIIKKMNNNNKEIYPLFSLVH